MQPRTALDDPTAAGGGAADLPSPPPAAAAAAAAPRAALRGRLLLADDTAVVRELTILMLKSAGAEVTAVENGQLALEQAWAAQQQGRPFDVVLMDLQMPVMDGFTATAELRRRGYTRPIVALTANAVAEDRRRCMAAGCDYCLMKPVGIGQLHATVAHYIAQADGRHAPSPPPESAGPGGPGDVSVLQSLYAERPAVAKLLGQFIACLDPRLQAMEVALRAGQIDEVRRVAHQLKGAAGSYGYPLLGEAAATLEQDARQGRLDAAARSLQQVAALCRAAIKGHPSAPSAGGAIAPLPTFTETLPAAAAPDVASPR